MNRCLTPVTLSALPPRRWLVTGVAGFIGSHLLQALLEQQQTVVAVDNFSTGTRANLEDVRRIVGEEAWRHFTFIEGDIRDAALCLRLCRDVHTVLHQAALGSVPRSVAEPAASHGSNVDGTLNLFIAAKETGVRRFIFASSSSVYGDHPALPKMEPAVGRCLSPYALTKRVCELYADVFSRTYGLEYVALRYFNVFGPRQDPHGGYAAVIPKWIMALLNQSPVAINGDGETSRDFCYITNVVQANLLAATTTNPAAVNQVYNIAVSDCTTLNALYAAIRDRVAEYRPDVRGQRPVYRDFRTGDVRHSHADISKARALLGYAPSHRLGDGLTPTVEWYADTACLLAAANC